MSDTFEHKLATAELRVGYETPPERVLDIMRQAIAAVPKASAGRPAEIGIQELGTGAMTIAIRYWVPSRNYFRSRFLVNQAALKALENNGIRIAV
ncbi:MAG: mechanosensitive ion channel family protein [Alphaproteobacteria bacterium]|nr:mechanosensitive ion channel family protein [Alphaproteobacteria bacterium]